VSGYRVRDIIPASQTPSHQQNRPLSAHRPQKINPEDGGQHSEVGTPDRLQVLPNLVKSSLRRSYDMLSSLDMLSILRVHEVLVRSLFDGKERRQVVVSAAVVLPLRAGVAGSDECRPCCGSSVVFVQRGRTERDSASPLVTRRALHDAHGELPASECAWRRLCLACQSVLAPCRTSSGASGRRLFCVSLVWLVLCWEGWGI